eukprot:scaffold10676_cov49-Cyclotella_meneghiniana.AAC.4
MAIQFQYAAADAIRVEAALHVCISNENIIGGFSAILRSYCFPHQTKRPLRNGRNTKRYCAYY